MAQMRITDGKGAHFTFDNGVTLSIQIGGGNYSDNYDEPIGRTDRYSLPPSSRAEIACWAGSSSEMASFGGDTVKGYVPVEDVMRFAEFLRSLPHALQTDALEGAIAAFDWREHEAA